MLMRPFCGMLLNKVCYKLVVKYVEKKGRGNHGGTWWWWNEKVKEAIQQKKVAKLKRCAKIVQWKTWSDIRILKTKQRNWLLAL